MTGDPARVFLDSFADIERRLRQKANVEEYVEFVRVVERLEPHDRLVREHRAALKAFAALRNAIVHDRYRAGQPIANPHPDVVRAICEIRDQLERPPRIAAVVQGRGAVEVVAPNVGVWQALRSMTERDHSQVLVYGKFVAREVAVVDVIDLLAGAAGRPAPIAVVVTHSGDESESPLGILVVHDLPDLLARVTVAF